MSRYNSTTRRRFTFACHIGGRVRITENDGSYSYGWLAEAATAIRAPRVQMDNGKSRIAASWRIEKAPLAEYDNTVPPAIVVASLTSKMKAAGIREIGLWVDDDLTDRYAPDTSWVHVTTQHQAQAVLDAIKVSKLSLDNDLSDDAKYGQGKFVVEYLCERQFVDGLDLWPKRISLHTANSSARDQMAAAIKRFASELYTVSGVSGSKFTLSPL